ncbi:hypothetical protein ACLOJK_023484 [Asimina triloba]
MAALLTMRICSQSRQVAADLDGPPCCLMTGLIWIETLLDAATATDHPAAQLYCHDWMGWALTKNEGDVPLLTGRVARYLRSSKKMKLLLPTALPEMGDRLPDLEWANCYRPFARIRLVDYSLIGGGLAGNHGKMMEHRNRCSGSALNLYTCIVISVL